MSVAGSEFYGDIRKVDETAIATQFFSIILVPIWPLRTYYLNHVTETTKGIPFIVSVTKREIVGLPCAHMNLLSIFITYVRLSCLLAGFGGGFGLLIGVIMTPTGSPAEVLYFVGAAVSLIAGSAAGYATYALTRAVRPRDAAIRRACCRCLDIAADPARIQKQLAQQLMAETEQMLMDSAAESDSTSDTSADDGFHQLDAQLVRTRAEIKCGGDRQLLEFKTNELLSEIESLSRA